MPDESRHPARVGDAVARRGTGAALDLVAARRRSAADRRDVLQHRAGLGGIDALVGAVDDLDRVHEDLGRVAVGPSPARLSNLDPRDRRVVGKAVEPVAARVVDRNVGDVEPAVGRVARNAVAHGVVDRERLDLRNAGRTVDNDAVGPGPTARGVNDGPGARRAAEDDARGDVQAVLGVGAIGEGHGVAGRCRSEAESRGCVDAGDEAVSHYDPSISTRKLLASLSESSARPLPVAGDAAAYGGCSVVSMAAVAVPGAPPAGV
jgi:hypothetical protein